MFIATKKMRQFLRELNEWMMFGSQPAWAVKVDLRVFHTRDGICINLGWWVRAQGLSPQVKGKLKAELQRLLPQHNKKTPFNKDVGAFDAEVNKYNNIARRQWVREHNPQSEELRDFYLWIDGYVKRSKWPRKSKYGLCSQLGYWVEKKFPDDHDKQLRLMKELEIQFGAAMLDLVTPFNKSFNAYAEETDKASNPARIQWIKDHAI